MTKETRYGIISDIHEDPRVISPLVQILQLEGAENLILNGLIIETGKVLSESKKISKLQCVFQEIKTDVKKGKISVNGFMDKKIFEKSTSMKFLFE